MRVAMAISVRIITLITTIVALRMLVLRQPNAGRSAGIVEICGISSIRVAMAIPVRIITLITIGVVLELLYQPRHNTAI